jgi:hypothetical protein
MEKGVVVALFFTAFVVLLMLAELHANIAGLLPGGGVAW